ncbi:recombinase family protein [Streptomyces mirabilis]
MPNPPTGPRCSSANARVSTGGQKLDRRIDALTAAGCRRIFADKKSGKDDLRPELRACHIGVVGGEKNMVGELRRREIGFCSLHERLDNTTPGGRVGGRPAVATPEILGVSPGTLYNHIPDLQELRASGRIPWQRYRPSWPSPEARAATS